MSDAVAALDAVPAVAAVELRPKNTNRLSRIFRKPKSTVAPRQWRAVVVAAAEDAEDEEGADAAGSRGSRRGRGHVSGVSLRAVRALVAGLDDCERARAASGLDPLSTTEQELARRAERFGILIAPVGTAAVAAAHVVANPDDLRAREARFGAATAPIDEETRRRLARFGAAPPQPRKQQQQQQAQAPKAPLVIQLSPEDQAAAEARAKRFGS